MGRSKFIFRKQVLEVETSLAEVKVVRTIDLISGIWSFHDRNVDASVADGPLSKSRKRFMPMALAAVKFRVARLYMPRRAIGNAWPIATSLLVFADSRYAVIDAASWTRAKNYPIAPRLEDRTTDAGVM